MTQVSTTNGGGLTLKGFFTQDAVKAKFSELLGKKSTGFITSVMQVVSNNTLLLKADMNSIYQAAAMAATLDLPINNSLGHAWIVPYGNKAQFQIGWKGFVQLAQRTGQYRNINVCAVYENQFKSWNELTEDLNGAFTERGTGAIVGYVAYFSLLNGFEKTNFWYKDKVEAHGRKYSKSFGNGPWKDNFDAMAMKTVLKSTLSKWGPLSIELQHALLADQSTIGDMENGEYDYPDNDDQQQIKISEELERALSILPDLHTDNEVSEFVFKVDTSSWNEEDKNAFFVAVDAHRIQLNEAR